MGFSINFSGAKRTPEGGLFAEGATLGVGGILTVHVTLVRENGFLLSAFETDAGGAQWEVFFEPPAQEFKAGEEVFLVGTAVREKPANCPRPDPFVWTGSFEVDNR